MAKRGHGSTWCLRISLAVYAWQSPFPGDRKLIRGSAHCPRPPCSFPASNALLAFSAGSRKSSRQRLFASIGKTRSHVGWSKCSHLSKALDWAYVPRHVLLLPCLRIIRRCVQPAKACLAIYCRGNRIGPRISQPFQGLILASTIS